MSKRLPNVCCLECRRALPLTGFANHLGTHTGKGRRHSEEARLAPHPYVCCLTCRQEVTIQNLRKHLAVKHDGLSGPLKGRRSERAYHRRVCCLECRLETTTSGLRSHLTPHEGTYVRTGVEVSDATRSKQSASRVRVILEGRGHRKHRTFPTGTLKGGYCFFRSTWEVRFAKILDKDSNVVRYLYESLEVPYFFEDRWHTTIPDFRVEMEDESIRIVEVTPEWEVYEKSERIAKMVAIDAWAKDEGVEFLWYDGGELREFAQGVYRDNVKAPV